MHWIIGLVFKNRSFFLLLLTVLLSLMMISSSPETQMSTVRVLTITVFYPFQLTFNQLTRIKNVFSENTRLRKELAQLNVEASSLKEMAIENERLRGLLNFSKDISFDFVPVRVVARDPAKGNWSVIVNGGKKDGIQLFMPLVGESGVVGKVVNVMGNMSLVQLLTDPSNRTSVLCRRTRTISILKTENGTDFFIQCRKHEDILRGDTIVTSGLGGIYPRGLIVGVVNRVDVGDNPLFKRAKLDLAVDFERLEEVFILRLSPQWSSFRMELDSIGVLE